MLFHQFLWHRFGQSLKLCATMFLALFSSLVLNFVHYTNNCSKFTYKKKQKERITSWKFSLTCIAGEIVYSLLVHILRYNVFEIVAFNPWCWLLIQQYSASFHFSLKTQPTFAFLSYSWWDFHDWSNPLLFWNFFFILFTDLFCVCKLSLCRCPKIWKLQFTSIINLITITRTTEGEGFYLLFFIFFKYQLLLVSLSWWKIGITGIK